MSQQQNAQRVFELVGRDAMGWLEQARTLKFSAEVLLAELNNLSRFQTLPGVREKKLAYVRSFMLLTGLAFENLIKGIFIASSSGLVSKEKLDTSLWERVRKGHGISTLVQQVTSLNSVELDLLKRLEEYIIWVGRYPIPMNSTHYFQTIEPRNLKSFSSTDPQLIDSLFGRLCEILVGKAEELWVQEAEKRYAEYRGGKIANKPAEQVFEDARRRLQ